MKRTHALYLVIGLLVVGLAVVGVYLYQEQHKSGIEVEINDDGLSVETH
jgi:hypothetical protein